MRKNLTDFVPIDDRPPATVRAVILARKSSAGTENDVQSQVEECQKFIERMGWTLVADPYAYTEIGRSGRYNVVRKVLESVIALAQQRKVDVIVAREMERLSRDKDRRALVIGMCEMYGVEWRFANLTPDGRLPDTLEGKMVAAIKELYGAVEAEMIAERTRPGHERRFAAGFPHGGRYGPPYGYRWRPKEPDAKTYSGYEIDTDRADIVREIFRRFANDERTTARGLAIEFKRRGVPTASGSDWSGPQILGIVRNPIYCGRGVRKRYHTTMKEKTDEVTGRKNDYRVTRDTLRYPDPSDSEHKTYTLAQDLAPALVEPALWEAAQQAIARNRKFGGKLQRVNSPHKEESTLLHGGFVFCARCGGMMTRHWRADTTELKPTYRCTKYASTPNHPCKIHGINAEATDQIVLLTVARALTDPEQLLELADKADQQATQATADAVRAETELEVYYELDAKREAEREQCLKAIESLSALAGDAYHDTISDLRAQLARLDQEQTRATEERKRAIPQLQYQLECARRRAQILERLTWVKDKYHHILDQDGKPTGRMSISSRPGLTVDGDPVRVLRPSVSLEEAAEILGVSKEDFTSETGIPVNRWWAGYAADDPDGKVEADVSTQHVVYYWLYNAPHDYVRQLLRDLNVKVLIKPPRTKEERALHGLTPPKERVIVKFLADPNEATHLRPSDKKPHDLSSLSR